MLVHQALAIFHLDHHDHHDHHKAVHIIKKVPYPVHIIKKIPVKVPVSDSSLIDQLPTLSFEFMR